MKYFEKCKMGIIPVAAALALAGLLSGCDNSTTTLAAVPEVKAADPVSTPQVLPEPYPILSNSAAETLLRGTTGNENIAFVGGGASSKIWVYDTKYHNLITAIPGDGTDGRQIPRFVGAHNWNYPDLHDNHAICFRKDFTRFNTINWGSYDEDSYLVEFDPKTMKETRRVAAGKGSHHCAYSPDDAYIYVANEYATTVSIIDSATFKKIKDLEVGGRATYPTPTMYWNGIAINTPYVFVTVGGAPPVSNTVSAPAGSPVCNCVVAIDVKTNTVVKSIPIGTSIHGVNLTPDGKEVWVAQTGGESTAAGTAGQGDITVIDVKTLAITKRIRLGTAAIHIVFSQDNRYAFVGSNTVLHKVGRDDYQVIWTATGEGVLAHLGLSPDQKEVWIQNHAMSKTRYPYLIAGRAPTGIQVFSAQNGSLLYEMAHEDVAHEIQFVPRTALGMINITENPAVAAGLAVFTKNCVACHAERGVGNVGPPLVNWYGNAAGVIVIVTNGKGGVMPAWGSILTAQQIKDVAAYVADLGNPANDAR